MKNIFFVILLGSYLPLTLTTRIAGITGYEAAIKEVFADTQVTKTTSGCTYKADVSYLFADLKFRDNEIKICEFGPARRAWQTMSKVIYNGKTTSIATPYWPLFWEYCSRLPLPVWFIGDLESKTEGSNVPNVQLFRSLGDLEKTQQFKDIKALNTSTDKLSAYKGIVVYTHTDRFNRTRKKIFTDFKKKHADTLVLDKATNLVANSKLLLATILEQPDLKDFKPRWGEYKKQYTPELAQTIINDLQSEIVVIKPINASRANGVIIVEAVNLDKTLKHILGTSSPVRKNYKNYSPTGKTETFEYWQFDPNPTFMVEAFESSHPIKVRNKWYNPTMRVVFILKHDAGNIYTTILGGYWEIPEKDLLDTTASLTEKHKTIVMSPKKTLQHMGLKITETDFNAAKKILYGILPRIYENMLIPLDK